MADRALLTGATGYIGSQLAEHMIDKGWDVGCIVLPDDPCVALEGFKSRISIFPHDGSTSNLVDTIKAFKPDVVLHLASCFLAEHKTEDVERLVTSNVLFGTQLLEAMHVAGINRLVNTGTSWQHYLDADYNPVCLYAATKQAFEDIIRFYAEARDIRCVTLKLLDTYGPDDPRPKLFSFLKRALQSDDPIGMSPGEQELDLVYIDDVVEAFLKAATLTKEMNSSEARCYAVRTGRALKLRDIVGLYERLSGGSLPIEFGGRAYRDREVMKAWSKAETVSGWQAKTSLEEGISKVLDAE